MFPAVHLYLVTEMVVSNSRAAVMMFIEVVLEAIRCQNLTVGIYCM